MNLRKISNEELLIRTSKLAQDERHITIDVLLHLQEIERRGIHLDRGFSSLYEYCLRELKYSEGSAYRRVQAMRLLRDIPEVREKISTGSLNLTTASKVQTAGKNQPAGFREELLKKVEGKAAKEVDLTLNPHTVARETMRWLSAEAVELKLQLEKGTFHHLEELKALKSHGVGTPTFGKVVADLIELGHEKWHPLRRSASSQRRSAAQSADPRHITPSLRAEIWKRDGGRCVFTDPHTGQQCSNKYFLQVDHIHPVALGGETTSENLRLLCSTHNQRRAAQTFGPEAAAAKT